ncbi:MAG: hypothetical protein GF390_01775 [Candidatus Pacebacteria bacterium]|nr:hypothetical protein [Candidatus Paceibacterota bacterium]
MGLIYFSSYFDCINSADRDKIMQQRNSAVAKMGKECLELSGSLVCLAQQVELVPINGELAARKKQCWFPFGLSERK